MSFRLSITLLLLFFAIGANAQQTLRGRVFERSTDSVLAGINVFNLQSKLSSRTTNDGRYAVLASEGDRVIFSGAGFQPDTITVTYAMLLTQYDMTLDVLVVSLKNVIVTGSYAADSLARRNYYRDAYNLPGIKGRNRPTDGVGISLSPLSYFSKKGKQQRALKKKLITDERELYIDHSFPAEWVKRVTNLRGDSLSLFLYRYRPTYDFCRKSDRDGMLIYINDKLKEFKKE